MISAQMVKNLRERTGSGMMECKRALEASGGDIDKAIEHLRTKGVAQADKKATRVTAQGMVLIERLDNQFIMLEINCETDFVAKSPDFINFSNQVSQAILNSNVDSVDDLIGVNPDIDKNRRDLVAKIGENITIRRFSKIIQSGLVGTYLHDSTMGAMVDVICADKKVAEELAKDLAMHIVAFSPNAIDEFGLDQKVLESERKILKEQAMNSGKPEEIAQKMIGGRIKKFIDEHTLLGQKFVKDQDISVSKLLEQKNATVSQFTRFKVGEGIEKKEEDFVAEVMSQVKKD